MKSGKEEGLAASSSPKNRTCKFPCIRLKQPRTVHARGRASAAAKRSCLDRRLVGVVLLMACRVEQTEVAHRIRATFGSLDHVMHVPARCLRDPFDAKRA